MWISSQFKKKITVSTFFKDIQYLVRGVAGWEWTKVFRLASSIPSCKGKIPMHLSHHFSTGIGVLPNGPNLFIRLEFLTFLPGLRCLKGQRFFIRPLCFTFIQRLE